MNEILVTGLRAATRIGVPEQERGEPQEIEIDMRLGVEKSFAAMGDSISETIDYAAVCDAVRELAANRPRQLVETLAGEICQLLLTRFGANSAEVEIRKFILPETRSVGVRCRAVRNRD